MTAGFHSAVFVFRYIIFTKSSGMMVVDLNISTMKKILIAVVLTALGVGVVAVYLIFSDEPYLSDEHQPRPATTLDEIASSTGMMKGVGTLKAIMSRNENLECAVNYEVPGIASVTTTGTVFFSNGRLRGDFLTREDNMDILSSTIVAENTLYSWSEIEGKLYGVEVDMTKPKAKDDLSAREAVPLDVTVAYDCMAWKVVDASIFVPPSDVIFRDFAEVQTGGFEDGTIYESPDDTCATCRSINNAEERASCAELLQCSL